MRTLVTLRHLRSFLAVVDTGSFTKAATRMFLTQSSLTTTIQQLEDDIGVKLFDRTTRSVSMTPTAARFSEQSRRLLCEFDAMIGDLRAIGQNLEGYLRIAAAPSPMAWLVIPSLNSFRSESPGVAISLREGGTEDLERRVLEGDVDFGLSSSLSTHPDLSYSLLFQDAYGVVCSKDHHFANHEGPIGWDEVAQRQHEMVGLASDTRVGSVHSETLQRFGLDRRFEEVSGSPSLYPVLSQGNRFSIIPALASQTHQLQDLPFIALKSPVLYRKIFFITRKLRSLSPSARKLQAALVETLLSKETPAGLEIPDHWVRKSRQKENKNENRRKSVSTEKPLS